LGGSAFVLRTQGDTTVSKYKVIQTEYRNKAALVQAFKDLGYAEIEVYETPANLFGFHGDKRAETANVILRRKQISPSANDLGFVWDAKEKRYNVVLSAWDSGDPKYVYNGRPGSGAGVLQNLKQAYAVADLKLKAKAKGLTVVSQKRADGKVVMVLRGVQR
jgi:hypothetical protein